MTYIRIKRILFAISMLIFFSNCSRQVDCASFDTEILKWYPYIKGESFSLINTNDENLKSITVSQKLRITHTTDYSEGGLMRDDCITGCFDVISISPALNSDFSLLVEIDENVIIQDYYEINGISYSNYTQEKNYSFDNTQYDNVRIYYSRDSDFKLYIAKEIGIIGLHDEDGLWTIVNQHTKSSSLENETEDYEIEDRTSC